MSKILIEDFNDYKIMKLEGDFVGGDETDKLSAALKKIAQDQKNKLIVELSKVTFLNSMALGVLLSANALFNKEKGKVILCNASDYLKAIFETTKLSLIFKIDTDVEDAKKSILQ